MSNEASVLANIKRGNYAPVYFLYGADEYPLHAIVKALKEQIVAGPMAQFNLDELSGQDLAWSTIIERARTLPVMASHRLVIAWGVQKMLKKSEAGMAEGERYVESPCPETVLVLTASDADRRLRFFKSLEKGGGVLFEGKHPRPHEVPDLIRQFAATHGKTMDDEAVSEMAELIGTERMWLRNEVEKTCLFVGERTHISLDDVRELMADVSAHQVWDLTDALCRKDYVLCMRLLESLFRENQQPVVIFGALARQIRLITQIKHMQKARYPRDAIGKALNMRWGLDKLLGYSRAFGLGELSFVYRRLSETDIRLKRSPQPPRLVLENLIADICLR